MPAEKTKRYLEKRKQVLNRLADHNRWYEIKNKDGEVAVIRIYDEISWWGITAEDFVQELDEVSAPEIVVAINCPGGDVFDGIAIYNALRSHPAKIVTRVDALAASAASVIVQAGDERRMLSAAQMMIHEAWGLAIGTASEMREFADLLDKQTDVIAGIYAARSGKDIDHFRNLMTAETWLTDQESVDEGLADEVSEPSAQPVARVARPERLAKAAAAVHDDRDSNTPARAAKSEETKSETDEESKVDEPRSEVEGRKERLTDLLLAKPQH